MEQLLSGHGAQSVQVDYGSDTVQTDTQGEYTLPDYLPEIRRILSVRTALVPSGRFLSGDTAEYVGTAEHTVIYVDAEGGAASTAVQSEYAYSLPCPAGGGEAAILTLPRVESTVCRLSGPRRLHIRSVIQAPSHVFAPRTLGCALDEVGEGAQLLTQSLPSLRVHTGTLGEIPLADSQRMEIPPEAWSVLACRGSVHVRETRCSTDGVECRGDVWLRALCRGVEGVPFSVERKLPFDETVLLPGVTAEERAFAYGRIPSVSAGIEGDGAGGSVLTLDAVLALEVESYGKEDITVVKDVYSTAYPLTVEQRQEEIPSFGGGSTWMCGFEGSEARGEGDLKTVSSVLDCTGRVEVEAAEVTEKGVSVRGTVKCSGLFAAAPDDSEGSMRLLSADCKLPFSTEQEWHTPLPADCPLCVEAHYLTGRCRLEADHLAFDGELSLTVKAFPQRTAPVVSYVRREDAPAVHDSCRFTAVYPDGQDTLWSIGKRYQVPLSELIERNALPEGAAAEADAAQSLDGVAYLLLRG